VLRAVQFSALHYDLAWRGVKRELVLKDPSTLPNDPPLTVCDGGEFRVGRRGFSYEWGAPDQVDRQFVPRARRYGGLGLQPSKYLSTTMCWSMRSPMADR